MNSVPSSGPEVTNIARLEDGRSVAVSWQPLTLEEARGFITHYTITAERVDNTARQRQVTTLNTTAEPDTKEDVLMELDPNKKYWVSVSASTSAGTSTNSNRAFVQTQQLNTSKKACVFKTLSDNSSFLQVHYSHYQQ